MAQADLQNLYRFMSRQRMASLWEERDQEGIDRTLDENRMLAAMRSHKEFYPIWDRLAALGERTIEIHGVNPILHTIVHAIQEAQLDLGDPPELNDALEQLLHQGFPRLSALHLLATPLAMEIQAMLTATESPIERYRNRLALVTQNVRDPEAFEAMIRHTGRNDRCPCASGKKFKRCCIDLWPLDLDPSHWVWLLPGGVPYLAIGYSSYALDDDPLLLLQNLSAVAHGLERLGELNGAYNAFTRMAEVAMSDDTARPAMNALDMVYWEIVEFAENHAAFAQAGIQAIDALLARDPDAVAPTLRISLELDHADFLTAQGDFDAARAIYVQAHQTARSSLDGELLAMVETRWTKWQNEVKA